MASRDPSRRLAALLAAAFFAAAGCIAHAADGQTDCTPIARVVSMQGALKLQRHGQDEWTAVRKLDTPICQGDRLHAEGDSRAAVLIQPETLIRLDRNSTIAIRQSQEETVVEFSRTDKLVAPRDACGAGYVITRFPRRFRVLTPFYTGSVDGTEFLVDLRCESARLLVVEGTVRAEATLAQPREEVTLHAGDAFSAGPATANVTRLTMKPVDAVQWTLYYPPLYADEQRTEADTACTQIAADERAHCLVRRAEQRLRSGGGGREAALDIEAAEKIAGPSAESEAAGAIVALVDNDKSRARLLAERATARDAGNAAAWIARSYIEQADFELEAALASIDRALTIAPQNALAQTRAAELLMSLGRVRIAARTARSAVQTDPQMSRAHTILGFVELARNAISDARQTFLDAIERDSSDPLPRLGLGLAMIRDGALRDGREQIEIAVALDPNNSLLRSYVGKAYYEENAPSRDRLAATQFGLAETLDPKDPTPWFYEAILRQSENQSVEALSALEKSIELNDNRAVYRSRLLLDQDRAARAANLAQIYQDLGFNQLAAIEGRNAVLTDPNSYAAHQFLADAYQQSPRQELAQNSEQLQALMRAPIGAIPVSPFRGFTTPFGVRRSRPIVATAVTPYPASFNAYEPLYERRGFVGLADALAASQDTNLVQGVVAGASDNIALSAGYGRFRTDGFGEDRALFQEGTELFAQVRADDNLHLQAEWTGVHSNRGIVTDDLFASRFTRELTTGSSTLRIGARYEAAPDSTFYFSAGTQSYEERQFFPANSSEQLVTVDAQVAELQYDFSGKHVGVIAGGAVLGGSTDSLDPSLPPAAQSAFSYDDAYLYTRLSDAARIANLELGVAQLRQTVSGAELISTDPKIGVVLHPLPSTALRLAMFRATQRQLVSNETLEPTQFAGFNQFWDDPTGSSAWSYGAGIDQKLQPLTHAGVEVLHREIEVPVILAPDDVLRSTWNDSSVRGYFSRAIPRDAARALFGSTAFAFSVELLYDALVKSPEAVVDGMRELHTRAVPISLSAFPSGRFSFRVGATYVHRTGVVQNLVGSQFADLHENFWTADLSMSYQLPRRHGRISIGVSNAFGRKSQILDSNYAILPIPPEQVAFARLSLRF